jgi:hypothetical protein
MRQQLLSVWLAARCREERFQRFLGATDEAEAAEVVRRVCGVTSRAEIDRDEQARTKFHKIIRIPYSQYHHNQES